MKYFMIKPHTRFDGVVSDTYVNDIQLTGTKTNGDFSGTTVFGALQTGSLQEFNLGAVPAGAKYFMFKPHTRFDGVVSDTYINELLVVNGAKLALQDKTSGSTTTSNELEVNAVLTNYKSPDAAKLYLSESSDFSGASAITINTTGTFTTPFTLSSGDGTKTVYGKVTTSDGSEEQTTEAVTITVDNTPPAAPADLTLIATSDNTGITATVIAPADSDVSRLHWRYGALTGNVSPSYPSSYTAGTAFGAGISSSVSPSTQYTITASNLTQLKTYSLRVWAEDAAGNISETAAQNYLYLSPPTPRLVITAANSATSAQAGSDVILTITAKDANGEVITNYAGPYTLTWTPTGGTATTLVSSSATGWSSGVTTATVSISGSNAGSGSFTATDNSTAALTNGTLSFTWYPVSFDLDVTGASNLTAGKPFSLSLTAKDANDVTVTSYSGAVALSINYTSPTSGTKSLSSSSLTAANFSSGAATLSNLTYADAGQITITAKDTTYVTGVTIQGTSSTLTFNPAAFTISAGTPPGGRSGFYLSEPFSLTVTAKDFNGLTTPNYRGTVAFSSTPASGTSLPVNYAFTASDSGTHTFSSAASCTAAGSYTITASDASVSVAAGTSGSFSAIRATLVISDISGALGTLSGGFYILNNDTNQIVSGDSSTTVNLSISEAVANSSAALNRRSFTVNRGSADFSITDTEAEGVTVTATTSPTMPVQSGTFTFGASETSTFRIEYNFEVTNYTTPIEVTTPEVTTETATTTTEAATEPYYTPPVDSAYNQATMYDAAVSSGYQSYSMTGTGDGAGYVAPSYTPTADGSMMAPSYSPSYTPTSAMTSQPAMMQPAMTATPSGMTYTPASGMMAPASGMTSAPADGGAYAPADGMVSMAMHAPSSGMTGEGSADGFMMPSPGMMPGGEGAASGTFGEGAMPGMFAPPAGMMSGGEGSAAGFMPPPGMMGGREGGMAFMPMYGPPAGGEGGGNFGPMTMTTPAGEGTYGPPAGMYGPPAGMTGGEGGNYGPMYGPPAGMMGGEGGGEGGMAYGPMYGPPAGMTGGEGGEGGMAFGPMYGPPPGMTGGEGGMAFGPM